MNLNKCIKYNYITEYIIFDDQKILLEFKVNSYITLKLEHKKTVIYVKENEFLQCKRLVINIPEEKIKIYDEINSIDEAIDIYNQYLIESEIYKENNKELVEIKESYNITPEMEFWGHCSNLQTWAENNYDTRLLRSNLAFPLLKKLVEMGDLKAKRIFKEEIARRLENGTTNIINYLVIEGYLNYLNKEELEAVLKNSRIINALVNIYYNDEYGDYQFPGLYLVLKKIKELSLNYYKSLIKKFLKSGNEKLCYFLEDFGFIYDLKNDELALTLLKPEETKIIMEIRSLIGDELEFSINPKYKSGHIQINNYHVIGIQLNYRKISKFPKQILKLKKLQSLSLSGNSLTDIPESIEDLKNLKYLILSYNKIISIPNSIGNMKKLKSLWLDNNVLASIPHSIGNLAELQTLKLNNNNLISIPKSLGNLKKIQGLNLRDNKLTSLPESIGNLQELKEIDFRGNNIMTIPESLKKRKEIKLQCYF